MADRTTRVERDARGSITTVGRTGGIRSRYRFTAYWSDLSLLNSECHRRSGRRQLPVLSLSPVAQDVPIVGDRSPASSGRPVTARGAKNPAILWLVGCES